MKSQNKWVIEQLEKNGVVSRNQAFKQNLTRLAARINDVKPVFEDRGQEIVGYTHKTETGKDYRYTLKSV